MAALAAAYLAYNQAVKRGTPDLLAIGIASGLYAASNKGIEASEKADLRYWSTLPHYIGSTSFTLANGEYSIYLKKIGGGEALIDTVTINNDQRVVSYRNQ